MTKQDYEMAYMSGIHARQSGKKRDKPPMFAMGAEGAVLRDAWRDGWDYEDEKRRKKA